MKSIRLVTAALAAMALTAPLALVAAASPDTGDLSAGHAKKDSLRWVAPKGFYIGTAAAGGGHHEDQPYPDPFTKDLEYRSVLAKEFSSVSAENQMKWEYIHPERDRYNFGMADAIVKFARQNRQVVRGHTLLWHSQNPAWLEQGDFTPEELREILREHITTVVGRYKGKIQQWDVANEIFTDTGSLRTTDNIWIRELGPGIIADAFRWAHAADPKADLYFNDYGVESVNAKSNAYLALIKDLKAQDVPVHGFSAQSHLSTRYGFPGDLETNLKRFADLGLGTAITELDVRMDLPANGVPTPEMLAKQADYYNRTLVACLNVKGCDSFTIWGFTDKYSWVPVFFAGEGAATVMWEDFTRKPAYDVMQCTLAKESVKRGERHPHLPACAK
ncbi:endo-1,4-beta-xylanase [Saccharothrix sp. 6-C]|uniref:endo-1,4-beta-xylanase n=1 Tax=Saccharothrix sp. 6-C TaxID=2781735 RepID=UPI00191713E2|nr:endo-1,4-beta-xylanase [Saccharothrix sp. 6-C]QQQ79951.1 endo-1,4-beta-xylanase [Saccharothrix sp. 6-C]